MPAEARYLADTNVLIQLIAGAHPRLRQRVEEQPVGAVVTSSLCVAEAVFGARSNNQEADLDQLLFQIATRPFDLSAARFYRMVPFGRGRLDRLIAAHALALNLTVVTNNEGDFTDVPGLRVENWTR